jgi:hypothetical protein
VLQAQPVLKVFKDLQVQLVNKVHKEFKVLPDRKEFRGSKVSKETLEQLVRQGLHLQLLALREQQA